MNSTSYLTPEVRYALQSGSLRNKEFSGDDRAALILMDYAGRTRLKIYAHVEAVPLDADAALARLVADPGYRAKPEHILLLHLMAFDWNCPQHITARFTEAEISEAVQPLRERLTTLEAENAELRAKLAAKEGVE
jgi:predicted pyridoxine 5'-phosphate oxidase superfamily flavin-nucleotide-binding protein